METASLPTGSIRRHAALRLLFLVTSHFTLGTRHSRKSIPLHGKRSILVPHIIAAFFEIYLFAYQDLWSESPDASLIDVFLSLVQSVTNAMLAWDLKIGIPAYTRPSYLAGAILRPALSILSYTYSDPQLHRISINLLDAFIYTRLLIFLLRPLVPRYRVRYAIAVTGGAIIASLVAGWNGGSVEGGLLDGMGVNGRSTGAAASAVAYIATTAVLVWIRERWQGSLEGRAMGWQAEPILVEMEVDKRPNQLAEAKAVRPGLSRSASTESEGEYIETPRNGVVVPIDPLQLVEGIEAESRGKRLVR